ncbi:hypothetical protein RXV86_14210 [Alisedimentitalea sp. MJ-SS2]|uniref:hypothetical protein n=1 Tax=Aliisedimentitalea sp. MJ-SS2 TaxID=3049795 RepID=UPI002909EA3A|nr:hypothetical protein [Alisedimentitalea sp. MJ-SS2]MDU8928541.1 hypothetical protein [Alisedimentitalea sp. MJ-SS2]
MKMLTAMIFALALPTGHALAQQGAVITDNWNKGGCGYTDIIRFDLSVAQDVGRARTWINWPEGVANVLYTLVQDGATVLNGAFTRNNCDPYQQSWCEGIADWNLPLEAGRYVIVSGMERVCQNGASGGNGFLALHRATAAVTAAVPVQSAQPQPGAGQPMDHAMIRHGISVGDFAQRTGPFVPCEECEGVDDFTATFATTQGMIQQRPSGVVNASGSALPGDVDVVLFALSAGSDISATLRPCSSSARMRLFDLDANLLGETEAFSSGYYGLYSKFEVSGMKEGAYALAIDYPDGSTCDGRNGWIAEIGGPITDPQPYVGPFEVKPDFSMDEGLDVGDLLGDITRILTTGQ